MPRTKLQSLVFTLIMVFCMVFTMTSYTLALQAGSLSYAIFKLAIREMWLEYLIVFVLAFFIISRIAKKLALRIFAPEKDNSIFTMLAIQVFTVVLMVPTITLIATFIQNGINPNWLTSWIELAFKCFPVALMLQILYIGPFVRFIYRRIFGM